MKNVIDLAARRAAKKPRRVNCLTLIDAHDTSRPIPGYEAIADVTSRILEDHPKLTPEELKKYLDAV